MATIQIRNVPDAIARKLWGAPTAGVAPAQPTRLDRLFGRLASRSASPLGR